MVARFQKGDKITIMRGENAFINSGTVNSVYFQQDKIHGEIEMLILINLKMHNGAHYRGDSFHISASKVHHKELIFSEYSLWDWY